MTRINKHWPGVPLADFSSRDSWRFIVILEHKNYFCRIGILYSFLIYCLPGLIKENTTRTITHKLASLTYPIILVSGIIVGASYWGLEALPYVSGPNMLYFMFPNLILSIVVGVALHLLFNFINGKKQEARVIWFISFLDLLVFYLS